MKPNEIESNLKAFRRSAREKLVRKDSRGNPIIIDRLQDKRKRAYRSRISREQVLKIREMYAAGIKQIEIAKMLQCDSQLVYRIINGTAYSKVV